MPGSVRAALVASTSSPRRSTSATRLSMSRHRLVFSPIYITPTLRRASEWYNPLNLALSGWEVSGIVRWLRASRSMSPTPVRAPIRSGAPAATNFYACRDAPNQVAPVMKWAIRASYNRFTAQAARTFDKTGWVNEPIGSFGNSRRDLVPRARHQQHQHDPGEELLLLVRSAHSTSACVWRATTSSTIRNSPIRERLVQRQRSPTPRAVLVTSALQLRHARPSWRQRSTSKPGTQSLSQEAPSGASCFVQRKRLRKAENQIRGKITERLPWPVPAPS